MKIQVTGAVLGLTLGFAVHAAVEGTVINGTTGTPQPDIVVTLVSMADGSMAVRGKATSNRFGRFRIDQAVRGQELLQAVHRGVTYNRLLQSGTPASQVTLEVYDVSGNVLAAKVLRHAVLLEPSGGNLKVRENILLRNEGKWTLRSPKEGTFRFFVPDAGADSLRVFSRAATGVPLQQTPLKTGEPGIHQLDLPIKPGDTQLDLGYTLPFRNPSEFAGRTLQRDVAVRLLVPLGVTLTGGGVRFLGQEQKTGVSNYAVESPEYKVIIESAADPAAGTAEAEEAVAAVSEILPRLYNNLYSILGLAFASLALGLFRLYRMTAAAVASVPAVPAAGSARRSKRGSVGRGRKRAAEDAARITHSGSLANPSQVGRHSAGAA